MRNRILIIFLLLGFSFPLWAQMHSTVEISAGGGWSTLGYKVQPTQADVKGSNSGSWGLQAHLGYAFFFTPKIGLGIGANFSHYGANASLTGTARWNEVTDTEGELYNHIVNIHSLRDKQDIYYIEIPLTCYFLYPIAEYLNLNVEVGVKYAIPLLTKASFRADVEHQGDYGIWGLNLYNVAAHGFYRESDFHDNYSFNAQNEVGVFLKVGVDYEMTPEIHLYGNVYGDYSFMDAFHIGQSELGFQNDRTGMEEVHSFMSPYNGLIATSSVSAKASPIQVGVEVGVRFIFPHKKNYPCKCYID